MLTDDDGQHEGKNVNTGLGGTAVPRCLVEEWQVVLERGDKIDARRNEKAPLTVPRRMLNMFMNDSIIAAVWVRARSMCRGMRALSPMYHSHATKMGTIAPN